VVKITPLPLCPRRKSSPGRKLGGPQIRSLAPYWESNLGHPSRSLSLYRLSELTQLHKIIVMKLKDQLIIAAWFGYTVTLDSIVPLPLPPAPLKLFLYIALYIPCIQCSVFPFRLIQILSGLGCLAGERITAAILPCSGHPVFVSLRAVNLAARRLHAALEAGL
jgi:hypothetical protein